MDYKEQIRNMNKALSAINGLYQKWYQNHTMNSYLVRTLNALYTEPDLTQKEISENYQMPPQTVNNAIQALKKEGYIELVQSERDKRYKKIVFTEAGTEYVQEMVSPLFELDKRIVKRMGITKYKQLNSLLNTYGEALEQEINDTSQEE